MNAFETKAVHAAGLFLDRKGYNVRETGWEDPEGAGADEEVANMPVRFDDISFMVMGETRALLRHHINALSEA